jgi:hypothetical protein
MSQNGIYRPPHGYVPRQQSANPKEVSGGIKEEIVTSAGVLTSLEIEEIEEFPIELKHETFNS